MLISILNNLTKEQRLQLHIRGIPSSLTSSWRTGKRRPTYAQCVYLAEITGSDLPKLLTEVALGDVPKETAQKFEYLIK